MNPNDQIRTEAGKRLFKKINEEWGSAVWGPVFRGIVEIEAEISKLSIPIEDEYPEGISYPEEKINIPLGYWSTPK